ncbi:hypothetical protein L210DRAFT_3054439 [Boletus edulis BED1]|uniref:Heterokaryon incompatibility domain-containing protein n=1 Tax=Boletus edulis BED1 TaxID=1328754 RepID=A0AAD4GI07_BOLED|nr:hypothetical protein L210DRAFT_3054439 [Boletus edulis BED1]
MDNLVHSLRTLEESPSSKIARLEKTIEKLHDEQAEARSAANEKIDRLNEIIRSLRANLRVQEVKSSTSNVILFRALPIAFLLTAFIKVVKKLSLDKIIEELRDQLATSQRTANQEKVGLDQVIDTLCAEFRARGESSGLLCNNITRLEQTNQELRVQLAETGNKTDSLIRIIHAFEQKHQCETLYAQGRIYNAAESLLEITNTGVLEDLRDNKLIIDWLAEFTPRCITALERAGDEAFRAGKRDEAVAAYFAALSLDPSTPDTMLTQWATLKLISGSVNEVLNVAAKFKAPRFTVYRVVCDNLEGNDRLLEAVECFRQMQKEVLEGTSIHDGQTQWELDFRARCIEKLEKLGDTARDSKKHDHDEVIRYYSNALSLDPPNIYDILLKRSNEEIELDPSSHRGYEGKYAALHGMGCHSEAFAAFKMMLSKLEQSPDPEIRELHRQYVDATPTIKMMVEDTIRHMPCVLIDIVTGHLHDKTKQAAAFEELPIYDELRSTMTTRAQLDHARIRSEVEKFYNYAMLSHKWQPSEPTFQMVENTSVYGLPMSPTNGKVQRFCELVRSLHFNWAWTDTCCVNQHDKGVHQESLVAMFRWYRGSSLTIVHLLGVFSDSQEVGCLWRSIWNTRGWTYQEYVASKVVQFYTEDWKPYLGLDIFNHKESPIIISEMQRAMNFQTQELAALQPGLGRVREKLYLASTRRTTREEDIAYSLFGIFNVAIPVIYGEGDRAVGRLLEHILTGSGDVTILAWTGRAGSYNSCLPVDLTVYNRLVPLHVPSPVETAEMDRMVTGLRSSLSDLSLAVTLHDHLNKLPSPSVAASRLRLAGIVFPVTKLVYISTSDTDPDLHVYRATTAALGDVEIETTDNFELSGMEDFVFIHPWISPLLDQEFSRRTGGLDCTTRALRLVARLRRRFGALLLKPLSRVQYKRVATDCLIMVQVREEISLDELMDGIDTVDIQ